MTLQPENPFAGLAGYSPVEKITRTSPFVIRDAADWVEEAARWPSPRPLWNDMWFEGEVCCLFADSNVGKSILAVQICDEISQREAVAYFDFEMGQKPFQMRYTDDSTGRLYQFNRNFKRIQLSSEEIYDSDIDTIIDHIEKAAADCGARIIVIDNISWICNRSESGDAAGILMQRLVQFKSRSGCSILVLAHTPKRNTSAPLNQNSLAGSKKIANFLDSIFAIGLSKKNRPSGRYIKQIKVRSCEMRYGEDNVIEAELRKEGCMLRFVVVGYGTERDNLDEPDAIDLERDESTRQIADMLSQGLSYRNIAGQTGKSLGTISDIAKKLRRQSNT